MILGSECLALSKKRKRWLFLYWKMLMLYCTKNVPLKFLSISFAQNTLNAYLVFSMECPIGPNSNKMTHTAECCRLNMFKNPRNFSDIWHLLILTSSLPVKNYSLVEKNCLTLMNPLVVCCLLIIVKISSILKNEQL